MGGEDEYAQRSCQTWRWKPARLVWGCTWPCLHQQAWYLNSGKHSHGNVSSTLKSIEKKTRNPLFNQTSLSEIVEIYVITFLGFSSINCIMNINQTTLHTSHFLNIVPGKIMDKKALWNSTKHNTEVKGIGIILYLNAINSELMAGCSNPSRGTWNNTRNIKWNARVSVSSTYNARRIVRTAHKGPLGVVPEGRNAGTFPVSQ